jgi:hypothetical protein
VEAHNDEDGGNEESDEDEDSDNPAIGGLEFIVGISTDRCALFVSVDAVIVRDNFKFEEMCVETDVCDKSVGSCTCSSGSLEDEDEVKSLPTRHAPPGKHLTCPICPRFWFCVLCLD